MNLGLEDRSVRGAVGYAAPGSDGYTFDEAIARIETAVVDSCDERLEWPARIVAGLRAAVDFMVSEPAAARALTVDSRWGGAEGGSEYQEMIDRFAVLLGAGAPRSERLPESTDASVVSMIASVVSCRVRAGTLDSLSSADPDLVFLALLPYLGYGEASRWSAPTT